MKILAVDSSAVTASVCLSEDRKICGEFFVNTRQKHSRTLMPMLENLLQCTGVSLAEIDLFAVSEGPGSFTGVRIGVSCVKGLAMPFDKPCVGISSLEAMARNLTATEGILCAVMDARCGQVYNALFSCEGGVLRRLTPDRAIAMEDLAVECSTYQKPIYLVGDGAELCAAKQFGISGRPVLQPQLTTRSCAGRSSPRTGLHRFICVRRRHNVHENHNLEGISCLHWELTTEGFV